MGEGGCAYRFEPWNICRNEGRAGRRRGWNSAGKEGNPGQQRDSLLGVGRTVLLALTLACTFPFRCWFGHAAGERRDPWRGSTERGCRPGRHKRGAASPASQTGASRLAQPLRQDRATGRRGSRCVDILRPGLRVGCFLPWPDLETFSQLLSYETVKCHHEVLLEHDVQFKDGVV